MKGKLAVIALADLEPSLGDELLAEMPHATHCVYLKADDWCSALLLADSEAAAHAAMHRLNCFPEQFIEGALQ